MVNVLCCRLARVLFAACLLIVAGTVFVSADESGRKTKVRVEPVYPELARRMHIVGVVKIEVTISPSGAVTERKLVGGNPVLAAPCMDVLNKWKFEPGQREDKQVMEFRFSGK